MAINLQERIGACINLGKIGQEHNKEVRNFTIPDLVQRVHGCGDRPVCSELLGQRGILREINEGFGGGGGELRRIFAEDSHERGKGKVSMSRKGGKTVIGAGKPPDYVDRRLLYLDMQGFISLNQNNTATRDARSRGERVLLAERATRETLGVLPAPSPWSEGEDRALSCPTNLPNFQKYPRFKFY